jgi:hypothetical protein
MTVGLPIRFNNYGTISNVYGTYGQVLAQADFANFDFTNTWVMYEGHTNPLLRSLMTPLTVTANNAAKTYDKLPYSGGNGVTYSSTPNGNLLGTLTLGGTSQGAIAAGSYSIMPGGLYSNQQGYLVTYANGTLTVSPAALMINGVAASNKAYDGSTTAALSGVATVTPLTGDTVSVSGTGSAVFADKNVGAAKSITVSGYSLSGSDSGNYSITYDIRADITARALTVSATGQNRVYDTTTDATVTLGDNRLGSDVLTLAYGSAAFTDKNVGVGKTVNVGGISVTGTDAGNYTFNTTAATTANITVRPLTMGATATNKSYDGSVTASVSLSDNRMSGDSLTPTYGNASFADKNVGVAKSVTITGITLGGVDATNYTYNSGTSTTADITARPLTITADSKTKFVQAADPAFTYRIGGMGLVLGDALIGSLTRASGEAVGTYPILQGTISGASNYVISDYLGSSLSIIPFGGETISELIAALNAASGKVISTSGIAVINSPPLKPIANAQNPPDDQPRRIVEESDRGSGNSQTDSSRDQKSTGDGLSKKNRSRKPGEVIAVIN